jgi:hypothetical protein
MAQKQSIAVISRCMMNFELRRCADDDADADDADNDDDDEVAAVALRLARRGCMRSSDARCATILMAASRKVCGGSQHKRDDKT